MGDVVEKKKGARPVYKVLVRENNGKFREVGAVFKSKTNDSNYVLKSRSGVVYFLVPYESKSKKQQKINSDDITGVL